MASVSTTPTTSPSKLDRDLAIDAINHLIQGKRHLLVQDYVSAVSSLQEACTLFGQRYGETANECGEAYFQYGRSLLEMARLETGVLGNALDGVPGEDEDEEDKDSDDQVENPDDLTEEEKAEVVMQVSAAIDENSRELEEAAQHFGKSKDSLAACQGETLSACDKPRLPEEVVAGREGISEDADASGLKSDICAPKMGIGSSSTDDDEDQDEEKKDEQSSDEDEDPDSNDKSEDTESKEEQQPGTSEGGGDQGDKEEEITNLQIAWEVLELSKMIFQRQEKPDHMKLGEIFLKLGEVSIESENYDQAIEDLKECLKIRQEILPPDHRWIAEVYYQMGLAHSLNSKADEAVQNFQTALRVIEDRIKNQEVVVNNFKDKTDLSEEEREKVENATSEVEELKSVIPDIKLKIEDAEDIAKGNVAAQPEIPESIKQESSTSVISPKPMPQVAKAVTDITHLVKRKRAPEEISGSNEHSTKKARQSGEGSNATNGEIPIVNENSPKQEVPSSEVSKESDTDIPGGPS